MRWRLMVGVFVVGVYRWCCCGLVVVDVAALMGVDCCASGKEVLRGDCTGRCHLGLER